LIGRVTIPPEWTKPVDFSDTSSIYLNNARPSWPVPLELVRGQSDPRLGKPFQDWLAAWKKSPEAARDLRTRINMHVPLAPDGSFRLDDIPAGTYALGIEVQRGPRPGAYGPFQRLGRVITIPPMEGGRSDEPLDLGVLPLQTRRDFAPGSLAPRFEITTTDGRRLRIPEDYAGKILLLDFSAPWDTQARFQVVRLNDLRAKFPDDTRLAFLSLAVDADTPETRDFIAAKGEAWPQAIVGPLGAPIPETFGLSDQPAFRIVIIDGEGRIVASEYYPDSVIPALEKLLGPAAADPAKP
jgi:hypothetical protein